MVLGKLRAMACALALALTGCGGGGGGDGPASDPSNLLFAVDAQSGVVAGFSDLAPSPGSAFGRQIGMSATGAISVALDKARDQLYVLADRKVLVYAQASKAGTSSQPARTLQLPDEVTSTNDLQLDTVHDRLFVAVGRRYDEAVLVYDAVSGLNGQVAPSRTFVPGSGARAIALDVVGDKLYATGYVVGVVRYDHPSTADGSIAMDGRLASQLTGAGLALDVANDRLYVADPFNGVAIVSQVSSLPADPAAMLAIEGLSGLRFDPAQDRLYVGAGADAYIFEHASALEPGSPVPAVAVQAPAGVRITGFAF